MLDEATIKAAQPGEEDPREFRMPIKQKLAGKDQEKAVSAGSSAKIRTTH